MRHSEKQPLTMDSTTDPILRVENLQVELGGRVILQNLTFDLHEHETLVILGPNGAGKTVLLRTLLGLVPHQGTILWKSGLTIGYVPQRVIVQRDLPVTVEDFFELQNVPRDAVVEAIHQVGIQDPTFRTRPLGLISSGQLQRTLISSALARHPDVLLFDEPMSGIDLGGEETVHSVLSRIQGESHLTIVMVTHDLSVVSSDATHALCINKPPYCYGTPKEVLTLENLQRLFGDSVKFFPHVHQ